MEFYLWLIGEATAIPVSLGTPVVTVASGGLAVVDVTETKPLLGMAVTEAANGIGLAVTKVASGRAVTFTDT